MEIDYEKAYKAALETATQWIKDGCTDKERICLESAFPQLRESEDERIRKGMIRFLESEQAEGIFTHEARLSWISYLEKQKEYPTNEEMLRTLRAEYEKGVADTIAKYEQKEQPAQSFNQKQFFAEKDSTPFEKELFLSLRAIKETKPSDEEIWLNVKEQLTPVLVSLIQKEQKPAESISRLTVQGKGVYKICPHCKSRMIRDDSKVYTSMPPQYGYNCPKCGTMEFDTVMYDNPEMEEQKSAEYGDEFIAEAEEYASKVNCGEYKVEVTEAYIAGALRANNKPAEWSEEDEDFINMLILHFNYLIDKGGDSVETYKSYREKLKSLRPPQYCENCRLKKSVQGWKPSEEQMEALDKALYYVPEEIGVPIAEIYGHFNKMKKKLM